MKGAGAFRRRSFFSTDSTVKGSFFSSSTSGRVISREPSSIFFPSSLISLARNCGGSAAFRSASIDQYSTGTNAAISFSRSTTRRTATLCTRPAERPRRTFVLGLESVLDIDAHLGLGQVHDVADGRFHRVARTQVLLDRLCFRGRLDHHQRIAEGLLLHRRAAGLLLAPLRFRGCLFRCCCLGDSHSIPWGGSRCRQSRLGSPTKASDGGNISQASGGTGLSTPARSASAAPRARGRGPAPRGRRRAWRAARRGPPTGRGTDPRAPPRALVPAGRWAPAVRS